MAHLNYNMNRVTLLITALVMLFCAPAAGAHDTKVYVYQGNNDKFSKLISFPGTMNSNLSLFGTSSDWEIRGWVGKETHLVTYQLYVNLSYNGDWRNFQRAADDGANDLELVAIDHSVRSCANSTFGCDLTETVGVAIPEGLLTQKAYIGFQVKLYAHSGDEIILDVTPAQIQSALLTANQFLPDELKWIDQEKVKLEAERLEAGFPDADGYGDWGFSEEVEVIYTGSKKDAYSRVTKSLQDSGWPIFKSTESLITTSSRLVKSTSKDADCGKKIGISYLSDGRTKTVAFLSIRFDDKKAYIKAGLAGRMELGKAFGKDMGNVPLSCRPTNIKLIDSVAGILTAPSPK